MKDMEAATVADTFTAEWVARFGVPSVVTTDRGTQFTSYRWSQLCKLLRIEHSPTTAYHPQANGMIERTHRQVKNALRARLASSDWPSHLPWVLLGLRVAPKELSGISSAELVFGAQLAVPGDFISASEPAAAEFLDSLRLALEPPPPTAPLTYAQVAARPHPGLATAEFVYIRRGGAGPPLAPPYAGPYKVLSREPKFFLIEVGKRQEIVSIDRLKPHLGPTPVTAATPPSRGRPAAVPVAAQAPVRAPSPALGGAPVTARERKSANSQV